MGVDTIAFASRAMTARSSLMRSLLFVCGLLGVGLVRICAATVEEQVAAATQAWIDAYNSRDPERVLSLYDTDAVLWGTTSPTLRHTPAARRDYFSNMSQRPDARVALGEQHVRVFGDVAVNSGTYTFTNQHDGKLTESPARFSFTYHLQNGRWMIVDHHSSAVPVAPK
jgi:uncharacterized protein (TIGR02246 family)